MPGRSDRAGRLTRWLILVLVGAALAAPFPILELSAPARGVALPMAGATFTYTYRQSIYDVAVREELRVDGDAIAIERAVSSDIRALEYFRWPGSAEDVNGHTLAWRAPANGAPELRIIVVTKGEQVIDTGVRRIPLGAAFGDDVTVTVRPGRRPLLLWLAALAP